MTGTGNIQLARGTATPEPSDEGPHLPASGQPWERIGRFPPAGDIPIDHRSITR
ncbi:hypothetical protein SAMN04487819_101236 [Actinopolyspora alba]|uniref:Uncharacterized protein n=1 Tax=Actinopolyspora alba TaxID=673379 RepID=A0A1I1TNN1_9ACTN|nr:hypothetical protein SAMN04487819_101236 [Actinopolyspora alba]